MIKDLKDLQALLKLCRKQGVTEINMQDLKIRFGDLPHKNTQDEGDEEIPTDELTTDQLIYFSAGGQ